jgi:hypothetical protein
MARSKQAILRPSSPEIHDTLTMWIINGTAPPVQSIDGKKDSANHNLCGCCTSDTVGG